MNPRSERLERPTHRILSVTALAAIGALMLAACGDPDASVPAEPSPTDPSPTTGAPSDPDSPVTSPSEPTMPPDQPAEQPDIDSALARAASLLGMPESAIPDDARVGRRGDEQLPLTADLVPGRLTVELDPDDTGEMVVTSVSVESEDGSQLVTVATLVEQAASYLGTPEDALDPTWRIGRRGDESFALTEDFVVGRYTVELDETDGTDDAGDGTGTFVVTAVTVELPGGARTVTADSLLADAEALLSTPEGDLSESIRIARRGDELLPLTKDFRIGRFTAELDDDGTGIYVVTAVQVELPGGVETVSAQE